MGRAPVNLPAASVPRAVGPLGIGMVLHPDAEYLADCADLLDREADFFEISPETLWSTDETGALQPSRWSAVMLDLKQRTGRPVVGHGLGLSPGTAPGSEAEERRLARWLGRIALD